MESCIPSINNNILKVLGQPGLHREPCLEIQNTNNDNKKPQQQTPQKASCSRSDEWRPPSAHSGFCSLESEGGSRREQAPAAAPFATEH